MTRQSPVIRIGLPRSILNPLAQQAMALGAPVLVSMGAQWDTARDDLRRFGMLPWITDCALDSAGYSAMLAGGYRWSVYDHVEAVATNAARVWTGERDPGPCDLPFPWTWWAAMDYCCEPDIAPHRSEVERRMKMTVETYEYTLDIVAEFWAEGFNWLTRPMPTLQGRRPVDYVISARALAEVWSRRPLTEYEQEDEREDRLLPGLIGVGSVCGREVNGPEGILGVLDALDRELPQDVRLHLFGVKGDVIPYLKPFGKRVLSVDSMAWDEAARREAQRIRRQRGVLDPHHPEYYSCDLEHRCRHMREWYERQLEKGKQSRPVQTSLF